MKKTNSAAFLPIGMGMGVAIGTSVGVATDNIAVWLPIGIAIGSGFGVAMMARQTPRRKRTRTAIRRPTTRPSSVSISMTASLTATVLIALAGSVIPASGQDLPPSESGAAINPDRVQRPVVEFPERALARGVTEGRVELECEVLLDGALTACRVVSENPPGVGFGQAALSAGRRARITIRDTDQFVSGTKIRFAISFTTTAD